MLTNPTSTTDRKAEMDTKVKLCRKLLDSTGAAGLMFTDVANISWLTGGAETHVVLASPASVGPVLITADDIYMCCDNIETARMFDEEIAGLGLKKTDAPWHDLNRQREAIESIVAKGLVLHDVDADTKDFLHKHQIVINENERARYRLVGAAATKCLEKTCQTLEPGWSEFEVAGDLSQRCFPPGYCQH